MNNRSKDIHFHRYDATIKEEKAEFINVIANFQSYLPLKVTPDLTQHWVFLYERTVGCVGVLKRWCMRALRLALKSGNETIDLEHLEETAPSVEKALEMAKEIVKGEKELTDDEEKRNKLSALLRLVAPSNDGSEGNGNNEDNGNRKKRRPGQQNPRRYTVPKKTVPSVNDTGEKAA